jgi:tRNA threonylcarbamoyladenosine biosynthesis protein TsaB
MRLLLIHMGGSEGSVALADAGAVVAAEVLPGRTSSELLVPVVRRLLESQGWALGELAAVGVVLGPGSFTGVRVGLSAAKGLVEAASVPLVGISRLALVAAAAEPGLIHAVLDAGRGEFYYGRYMDGQRLEELLVHGEDLDSLLEGGGAMVVCEAKVAEALAGRALTVVPEPLAGAMLPLVRSRVDQGEFDDPIKLDANYLRQMDVEILARMRALR